MRGSTGALPMTCNPGPTDDMGRINITTADLKYLEEKGWKVIAGWLLSPQAVAAMELLPRLGVQGTVGPS